MYILFKLYSIFSENFEENIELCLLMSGLAHPSLILVLFFKLKPLNRKKLTMSESLDDMHAYRHLTDSVLEHILFSQKGNLKESKDIIQKILTRQLYKCVGQSQPPADTKLEVRSIQGGQKRVQHLRSTIPRISLTSSVVGLYFIR